MASSVNRQSKTERAGLSLSVSKIERHLRKARIAKNISPSSAVYTAATIEYLCAELLELAGNAAQQNKKVRITPRHIMMAIACDAELTELLKDVHICEGGVMPSIHPSLLPENSNKAKKSKKTPTVADGSGSSDDDAVADGSGSSDNDDGAASQEI